jgi:hypothetical protein
MSNLRTIYTALANVPVALNGSVVTALDVDKLPETVAAANLPLRLIMPLGTRPDARAMTFESLNGVSTAEWRITDLFLLQTTAQRKLEQVAPDLANYMAAYVTALSKARALAGALIENVSVTAGVYVYPAQSNATYFGVEATVTVREIVR